MSPIKKTSSEDLKERGGMSGKVQQGVENLLPKLIRIIEIAHLVYWDYDFASDIFTLNDRFYKILRTSEGEVGGYTLSSSEYFRKFIHPDDIHIFRDALEKLKTEGDTCSEYQMECRMCYGDGEIGYFLVQYSCFNVPDGQARKLLGVIQDITDHKETKERLQTITNSAQDAIIMMDSQGRISFWNPAAEKILGYSSLEAIGRNLHEFLAPQRFHAAYFNAFPEFKRSGSGNAVGKTIELFARRKDGIEFPMELSMSSVSLFGEWSAVGILRDISDRTWAEEVHRRDEERLEAQLTLSRMTDAPLKQITDFALEGAISLTDSQIGYLAFMNEDESILTMHSWSRTAMEQCRIVDKPLVYPLESTGLWGEAVRQRKPVVTNEYQADNPLKKGFPEGHVPLTSHMNLPVFDDNKIVAVVGVGNKQTPYVEADIRQLTLLMRGMWMIVKRRKTEQALREGEKRFRDLAEMLPEVVFEVDKEMVLTFVNQQAFEIFGYSRQDFEAGMSIFNLFVPEDINRARENAQKRFSGELSGVKEYRGLKKDGSSFPMLIHASAIVKNGNAIGLRGILVDITERTQVREQLFQSQKMRSVGTLAGGIAHDFNNILMPMIGFAQLMKDDLTPDSPQQKYLDTIITAAFRAKDLVKQILTFSRQSEHVLAPVRIQKIIKEALHLSRSTIPSNIDIRDDIQPDCPVVMADSAQVHQIVMNLIINAYHAVEKVGGELLVRLKETVLSAYDVIGLSLQQGRYVMLSVSDTGCGMDSATMEKIFEPYFTTKTRDKGTGLGLAVVYGIVKAHQGDIKVRSEVGKGTQIHVYFPIAKAASEKEKIRREEPHPTGSERILLVDDEKMIVALGGEMLERLGYQVTTCLTSAEALEVFKADPQGFDLLITDMTMPNMTGDQLAEKLIAIRPDIPIIMCTGFNEKIDKDTATCIGIRALLMKPITISEMSRKVRGVLDGEMV